MAKIILLSQTVTKSALKASIPGNKIGKVFFQCVLRELAGDTATFGLVAYGARKNNPGGHKNWELGTPVYCNQGPVNLNREFDPFQTSDPWAFGNMEVRLKIEIAFGDMDVEMKKQIGPKAKYLADFIQLLNKLPDDKELIFEGGITENPHIDYTVTISGTSGTANPCPPYDPGE
jgi:hypothetical protein